MKIAGVIVAAGRSTRFGSSNKLLANVGGKPVVSYAIDAASAAPFDDIVLVVGPDGASIATAAAPGRWRTVINADPGSGLSSSIQAGLSALATDCDGAMIILADMPFVSSTIMSALCEAFRSQHGRKIIVPQTPDGQQGNPVVWPRAMFANLQALRGDTGGKAVLSANSAIIHAIKVHATASDHAMAGAPAISFDIDTVADLDHARKIADERTARK